MFLSLYLTNVWIHQTLHLHKIGIMQGENVMEATSVFRSFSLKLDASNWTISNLIYRLTRVKSAAHVQRSQDRCHSLQARKRLKESRCGFVLGMPMVCTREEEVQPSPTCSLDTDFCPAMAGDMVRPRLGPASKCGL